MSDWPKKFTAGAERFFFAAHSTGGNLGVRRVAGVVVIVAKKDFLVVIYSAKMMVYGKKQFFFMHSLWFRLCCCVSMLGTDDWLCSHGAHENRLPLFLVFDSV